MRHATLGASSAKRWMNCPASIRLAADLPPSPTNKYAAKGTVAHAVGEAAIRDGKEPKDYIGLYGNGENDIGLYTDPTGHEFEFQVDAKMARDVAIYTQAIRDKVDEVRFRYGVEPIVSVEKSFELHFIQIGMFGTNDCSIWVPGKYLGIFDYKNGRGLVEVEDNHQLKYYGLGAVRELCWTGTSIRWFEKGDKDNTTEWYGFHSDDGEMIAEYPIDDCDDMPEVTGKYHDLPEIVELCVVQPNASHVNGPVRFWPTSAEHLVVDFAEELRGAAEETTKEDCEAIAGDHCTWCTVKPICPAQQDMVQKQLHVDFGEIDISELNPPDVAPRTQKKVLKEKGTDKAAQDVLERTPEELGKIVAMLPLIEAWCKAIASHAQTVVENGGTIEGQKLVATRGKRSWKSEDEVKSTLELLLAPEEYLDDKLKSFTEIEALPGMAGVVKTLTNEPKEGLTLAPDSDKRPEVKKSAAKAFEDIDPEDLV